LLVVSWPKLVLPIKLVEFVDVVTKLELTVVETLSKELPAAV